MFGAFSEIDRLMSDYREDSELTAINRRAAREAVPVSAPMMAVLQAAARVSGLSEGAFDVTVGPLVRLWGFDDPARQRQAPPPRGEIDALLDALHTARTQHAPQRGCTRRQGIETEHAEFKTEFTGAGHRGVDHDLLHWPRLRLLRRRHVHDGEIA